MTRVVMVTGVAREIGARFAAALAAAAGLEVIGVDVTPPHRDLGQAGFVRADIRNPMIGKVIAAHRVETVVHLAIVANPGRAGRSSMKEINVIGTMQLLAACQRSESFRKLVVQSSASVYGASPRDPARFSEEMSARARPRTGFGKDSLEIEGYVRGLGRRRPDTVVTTLRLASLMGAGVDSQLTRFLSLPAVPRVLGFDARLQFLHPDDAVAALLAVTRTDHPGTYNVAAPDVVTLTQTLRLLGRPSVGVPRRLAPLVANLARQSQFSDLSADQLAAMAYGRVMDTSRFLAATGVEPKFTSKAALAEFATTVDPGWMNADRVDRLLGGLADQLANTGTSAATHGRSGPEEAQPTGSPDADG